MTTTTVAAARHRTLNRLLRSRSSVIAAAFLLVLVFVAIFGPFLSPSDPADQEMLNRLAGPSSDHWLGTDALGRDNLSRLIQGARVTLLAALQALSVAVAIGVPAGLLAGFVEGWTDGVLNWVADVVRSMPPLILALAIVGIFGPGLTNAMIAIGIVFIPRFFRVARAAASSVRHETYIEATRAMGCSTSRILFRHVLPNSSAPLLVQVTYSLGLVITAEASLSFLGLGVRPPTASWGGMVREAMDNIYTSTFPMIAPSVMIILTILAFSVLGDGLRDAMGRQSRVGD